MKNYKIDPGELNKRIAICEIVGTQDAEGHVAGGDLLTPVRECWAKFSRTSGTEAEERKADFGRVQVRFLIRTPQDEGQYTELICVLRSNDTEGPRLEPVVDAEGYYATATVEGRRRWQGMTPDTEEVYAAALAEDLDEYAPEEVGDDAAE